MNGSNRFAGAVFAALGVASCAAADDASETTSSIAEPSTWSSTATVLVNQLGYPAEATKIAVVISTSASALQFDVISSSGTRVWGPANTVVRGSDAPSGESVHHADFSAFTASMLCDSTAPLETPVVPEV